MVRGALFLRKIKTLKPSGAKQQKRARGKRFCPNVSYFSDRLVEGRRGVRVKSLVGVSGDLILPEEAVVPQLGDPLLKQLSRLHLRQEKVV